jgi:outer membrane beta-barrel protein
MKTQEEKSHGPGPELSQTSDRSGAQSTSSVDGASSSKKLFENWGVQIGVITFAVVWLVLVAANWAQSAELDTSAQGQGQGTAAKPAESPDSDTYNFNWLDPEKKIYVLQNRRFLKAQHVELSLMAGPGSGNAYRSVFNIDPRLTYYFSEDWGLEAFYTNSFNTPNSNASSLQQVSPNTPPFIREIHHEVGAMFQWIPWYAKINVFNSILYFDWYFALGGGEISSQTNFVPNSGTLSTNPTTTNESLFAINWGTGQLYHLDQHWDVRLDMTSAIYHGQNDQAGDKSWFSNYNFEIGFGYRL